MVAWNPQEWANRTHKLEADERGVLADLRNMLFLRMHITAVKTDRMAASMDTWGVVLRMSTDAARKTLAGLEAAGAIRTIPRPDMAKEGSNVLMVVMVF